MNLAVIWDAMPQLLRAVLKTVEYSVAGIVFALIIGLITAFFKLSRLSMLRTLANLYIEMFRCTPLLVQIMFIYFGLAAVLPMHDWFGSNYVWIAGTAAIALNEGAYITEIIRGGIVSVDRGQKEAAHSIGMTGFQTMIHIVLPQAFKRMIPPLVNQSAQTIKDTSLLAVVGIAELIYTGQVIVSVTFQAFKIYGTIAVFYFIIIWPLTRAAARLERRLQVDKR
jgi:glutamine transport system permease protein